MDDTGWARYTIRFVTIRNRFTYGCGFSTPEDTPVSSIVDHFESATGLRVRELLRIDGENVERVYPL